MDLDFGIGKCKELHSESVKNEVLLYSPGNCIQSPGINCSGKEYKKEHMCVCLCVYVYTCVCVYIYITVHCTEEISTTL